LNESSLIACLEDVALALRTDQTLQRESRQFLIIG